MADEIGTGEDAARRKTVEGLRTISTLLQWQQVRRRQQQQQAEHDLRNRERQQQQHDRRQHLARQDQRRGRTASPAQSPAVVIPAQKALDTQPVRDKAVALNRVIRQSRVVTGSVDRTRTAARAVDRVIQPVRSHAKRLTRRRDRNRDQSPER